MFAGTNCGGLNTTGSTNAFTGFSSGLNTTTGERNTALGYNSGPASGNGGLINTTAIGSEAVVTVSNKIRLGNNLVSVIDGQVPYSYPSDTRFKYAVQANVPGLAFINRLQPVAYRFDGLKLEQFTRTGQLPSGFTPDTAAVQTGFLAQDVERVARALSYRFDGVHAPANARDHYSLAYSQFVMPLVQAVQELSTESTALQARNAALQASATAAEIHAATLDTFEARLRQLEMAGGGQARR